MAPTQKITKGYRTSPPPKSAEEMDRRSPHKGNARRGWAKPPPPKVPPTGTKIYITEHTRGFPKDPPASQKFARKQQNVSPAAAKIYAGNGQSVQASLTATGEMGKILSHNSNQGKWAKILPPPNNSNQGWVSKNVFPP